MVKVWDGEKGESGREAERMFHAVSCVMSGLQQSHRSCGVWAVLFVCLLVAYRPSNMRVYLRDGSAQTILRAATLR